LTDHGKDELLSQFRDRPEYSKIDQQYFDELLVKIYDNWSDLQKSLEQYVNIPISQMDPVELAILILGYQELESQLDIPFRVIIDESINLAKTFGSVDGFKYINAVLDRVVRKLRSSELQ
jgi:N utilization substance protein B